MGLGGKKLPQSGGVRPWKCQLALTQQLEWTIPRISKSGPPVFPRESGTLVPLGSLPKLQRRVRCVHGTDR